MKLLNCTVQLGGDKTHSVGKTKITELELNLIRHIHGNESIENLRQVGEIEVERNSEYRSLARFYGAPSVEKCFDIKLDGFSDWLESTLQDEEAKRYEKALYDAPAIAVAQQYAEEVHVVENEFDFEFDGEGNPVVAAEQTVEPIAEVKEAQEEKPAAVKKTNKSKTVSGLE